MPDTLISFLCQEDVTLLLSSSVTFYTEVHKNMSSHERMSEEGFLILIHRYKYI